MIYELKESEFEETRPLFRPLAEQPFCTAVLAGIHPGRVFVDDPDQPRTACVTREDSWCFLAGDPGNDDFNRALNQAIYSREVIGEEVPALLFTCHPEGWHGPLATILHPRQPIPMPRRHYVGYEVKYDWRAALQEGFVVHPMDETLLTHPGLTVPDEVKETIEKWRSPASTRFSDFGFVTIHSDATTQEAEVVSWATVDAIVAGIGDAGLFTVARYRRRGLATITTAAAVEYGLSQGVSAVNWTCAESNVGSIRIAEKLGFQRRPDYTMYYFVFDERYQESVDLYEQVFALTGNPPAWAYHDAAQAWAALGNQSKALEYLRAAADRGWTDVHGTQECKEFETLHSSPEWAAVLERMQQRKQAPSAE
jgi:RimJ/RimL family protein N-acetyltransferase